MPGQASCLTARVSQSTPQAFFDGLQSHGEEDIVMLPRAGWVGTWRHGAVLWSGDIGSTMTVLKSQVNIGVSAQTSAIPWWTTDVGESALQLKISTDWRATSNLDQNSLEGLNHVSNTHQAAIVEDTAKIQLTAKP
eukprot:SAG31_NODE_8525_length_1432_cov_6.571856_2_plen_136_part_00